MSRLKSVDIYLNKTKKELISVLLSTKKYTKILLLSVGNNGLSLKKDLINNQITPIEIVLDCSKQFDLFTLSQILCVNEDVRAVVATDECLFNVAKSIAEVKGVDCYLIEQGIIARSIVENVFVKCNGEFISLPFGKRLSVFVEYCGRAKINTTYTLICCLTTLIDHIVSKVLTANEIDFQFIDKGLGLIYNALNKISSDEFYRAVLDADLFISKNCFLPSYEIATLLLGNGVGVKEKACFCKHVIDNFNLALNECKIRPKKCVDYSYRITEMQLSFALDRLKITQNLKNQLRSINANSIEMLTVATKSLTKLFNVLIDKVAENQDFNLDERQRKAVLFSGDLNLSVNCMSAVREFSF